MALTDPAHYKGAWGGDAQPSPLPGWRVDMEPTIYVDENGNSWRVEAYVPGLDEDKGDNPTRTMLDMLNANPSGAHWRATLTSAANTYGDDNRYPSISGSESQYKAVLAIDEYARNWKTKNVKSSSEGLGVLALIALIWFVASDKRKR
jgi:hypothetical protein